MKVIASLTPLALALSALAAPAIVPNNRCETGRAAANYIRDNNQPWIRQLFSPCVGPTNDTQLWSSRTCVAAAIAMGPAIITDFAVCDKADTAAQKDQYNLDYGVYASIVGDCAYDKKACKITPQNLLDLVYSELSKAHASIYPADAKEILADVIGPVSEWAQGSYTASIGYTRFNQWLHVSGYPGTIIDGGEHTNGRTYFYDHEDDRD